MRLFLGIDPGRLGGVALIEDAEIITTIGLTAKTYRDKKAHIDHLKSFLRSGDEVFALLEKPRIWPGVKMSNLSQLIRDAGIWEGWLQAMGVEIVTATPREWQSPIMSHCGERYGVKNSFSKKTRVETLVKFYFGEKALKTHCMGKRGGLLDGVCDALLMSKYLQMRSSKNG
ncbi:MAG: RuvC family protein [Planctomycetota bacterium]|jgi:hypothetical protein